MPTVKRISANLPEPLLREAVKLTGEGITETIIHGLELIMRSKAGKKARKLKGKLDLKIDIAGSRERDRC